MKQSLEKQLAKKLNIPQKMVENGGMFLVDFTKKTLITKIYLHLTEKLTYQLQETIRHRYKFLHTDDTRLQKKIQPGDFDDKVIIVDEVHNLINTMAGGTSARGKLFYKYFMEAKNSKIIFLTGTPLINTIYESVFLFNILRGPIPPFTAKIKTTFDVDIQYSKIKNDLQKIPHVDQVVINKVSKTIKVTRTPDNFITTTDNKESFMLMAEITLDVLGEKNRKCFQEIRIQGCVKLS